MERIAAQALGEVPHIGGTAGRILGVAVTGEHADRSADVSAHVRDDDTAELDIRLSIDYPQSVAGTAQAARAHMQRRLAGLTGLAVTRVDITVTALHLHHSPTRSVQ